MVFKKPNFGQPPDGYIAGLGRGAVGFITRGDVGTARVGESTFGGQQLNAPPGIVRKPEQNTSELNYDEWSGYGGSLFSGLKDDQEDREADAAYAQVDTYMMGRRQQKQQQKIEEINRVYAQAHVNIKSKFVDIKKKLADVSREDWEALPDAQDLVKQNKRKRQNEKQRYTPVPDSVLQSNSEFGQMDHTIDAKSALVGGVTSQLIDGTQSTIAEVGEARQKLFQLEMNRAQSQTGTITSSINKEGYMTDLNSLKLNTETEINDLKKARILLKAVIKANPSSESGWVAAARVEELDGKLKEARTLLQNACEQFPKSEDIWFEASRLQEPSNQKQFLAKAVQNIPSSKKLWMLAAQIEKDSLIKSKVLRRALEYLPTEVEIWKELVQLENEDEAKILLEKAVTCIPQSVTLWLALAKLEDYKNARQVLNQALHKNPQASEIYMAAAKLEEAQQNIENIPKIIKKMVKNLQISRDIYLQEAVKCEMQDSLLTCECIIDNSITLNLDDMDIKQLKQTWLQNVQVCLEQGAIFTAKFILKSALKQHDRRALWLKAFEIEKKYGKIESQLKLLQNANTKHEFIKLLLAKILWKQQNQPEQAIQILKNLNQTIQIKLAMQKIYRYLKQYDNALNLLDLTDSRISMQRIQIYREMNQIQKALDECNIAIQQDQKFWKLHLIKAQIIEQLTNDIEQVRQVYESAILICGKDQWQVWTEAALYEVRIDAVTRARTILNKARQKLPQSQEIWLHSIRLEIKSNNEKIAQHLLSRALQQCPESGQLWALAIEIEPQATRLRKSTDAVQKNQTDPYIFLSIGKIFWAEGKEQKARKFLQRAVELNNDLADAWVYLYTFEKQYNVIALEKIKIDFEDAEPKHGELWQSHSKKIENWSKPWVQILCEMKVDPPKLF